MATKTWKNTEKRVAKLVGGKRVGNRGVATEDIDTGGSDMEAFSIECKHSASLPAWLRDGYAQAKRNAPAGKLPLLVVHPKGSKTYFAVLPIEELVGMVKR